MLYYMAGRPRTIYTSISEEIFITTEEEDNIPFGDIVILCPICHTNFVGPYGFQHTKTGTWQKYQCKNPGCPWLLNYATGKQFVMKTSALFRDALKNHLNKMIVPLIRGDTTQTIVGKHTHRSPALMTYIRHKIEDNLEKHTQLKSLVIDKPLDDGVAMDEWFMKINGEAVYIIMATSYGKKKVLGVKVAISREESMMRTVFDEAENNNGKQFSLVSIDAWGGSMKMIKNLNRPISAVIHKHKSPYDKAIIWEIEYTPDKRIIHNIGVQTDFFRKRKKRQYFYFREEEDLTQLPPKKRGRPKGVKNGRGKGSYKKIPKDEQKKRGPKGIFQVFDRGKKGYAFVDPGKKSVKIAKGGSGAVGAVLNRVILFFCKMTIQNNLAENKNSVVEHRVWRSGPKDQDSFEKRLRTFLFFLNNPRQIQTLRIDHSFRGDLMFSQLKDSIYSDIFIQNYQYYEKSIEEAVMN